MFRCEYNFFAESIVFGYCLAPGFFWRKEKEGISKNTFHLIHLQWKSKYIVCWTRIAIGYLWTVLRRFVLMSSCIMSNWGMGKSGVPKMAITGEGSHLWEWPGRLDTRNTNSAEGRSCHSQPGPPRHCGNDKNDKRQPAMLPLPEDAARLPAGQHLCCLPWHGCGQQAQQTSPPTRNLESAHCGWMAMAGQKM